MCGVAGPKRPANSGNAMAVAIVQVVIADHGLGVTCPCEIHVKSPLRSTGPYGFPSAPMILYCCAGGGGDGSGMI